MLKASKILLHKINYITVKNKYELEQNNVLFTKNSKEYETSVKSQVEEIKNFLHTVHKDLELFLRKNKKDFSEMNMKSMKLTELANRTMNAVDITNDKLDKLSLITACQLEFCNMQQSI